MFIHDVIKIKYIRAGYLPVYTPSLIADEDMCYAFLCYRPMYHQIVESTLTELQRDLAKMQSSIDNIECRICSLKWRSGELATQIAELIEQRDALPEGDPQRAYLQYKIDSLTIKKSNIDAELGTENPATGLYSTLESYKAQRTILEIAIESENQTIANVKKPVFDADFYAGKYPCIFFDWYPCVANELFDTYKTLIDTLISEIDTFCADKSDSRALPDWVYQYMLGSVIGPVSDKIDIHDLLVLLDADNMDDIFDAKGAGRCYQVSKSWLAKLSPTARGSQVPTIFGAPHVVKALRVAQAGV